MALIEEAFEDTLAILGTNGRVAVRGAGELPHVRTEGHHPADVIPIRAAIREQLGVDAVVMRCADVSVANGVVRRLLVLESLDDGSKATDLKWIEPRHASLDALQHISLESSPPDGRDWMIAGWWARVTAWITQRVRAAGLGRVLRIEQIRAWEFSCVLRVHTDQADLYCKALPRAYAHEPRLARHLADHHPGSVPQVVATDEHERWLLTRACPGQCLEAGAPLSVWERAAAAYADLQVASTPHVERLRALGCRLRGPLQLRSLLAALCADEDALLGQGEHGLSRHELTRLQQLRASLEAACDELADSGLPLALEHGDLWSSNVFVSDTGINVAFIDWTDANVSHPFFSLMPLLQSATWDVEPAEVPNRQSRLIDQYLEPWTRYASRERLRRTMALARPLAALHIATTYWRDTPQPHTQWWMPRMVPFFARLCLEQWEGI
jgi:phosphotransferase family enzyme